MSIACICRIVSQLRDNNNSHRRDQLGPSVFKYPEKSFWQFFTQIKHASEA